MIFCTCEIFHFRSWSNLGKLYKIVDNREDCCCFGLIFALMIVYTVYSLIVYSNTRLKGILEVEIYNMYRTSIDAQNGIINECKCRDSSDK